MSHLAPGGLGASNTPSVSLIPSQQDITRRGSLGSSSKGRRRSTVGNVLHTAESIKEKQARAKEAREHRRVYLTPAHKYILGMVGNHLKLELSAVEELILDSERNIRIFETFMNKDGTKSLKFYYQEAPMPSIEECGRVIPGVPKGTLTNRLFITSGTGERLNGICVYFIRTRMDINITIKNVAEEVSFGVLDLKDSDGILTMFEMVMSKFFFPMIQGCKKMGELDTTPQGRKTIQKFFDTMGGFIGYLQTAQANAGESVRLVEYHGDKVNLDDIKELNECIHLASDPDIVSDMEDLTNLWCKQIEQILAESDQMRKEADDTGPIAELDHWRQLTARFNALLDQIKSHKCRMVINIVHVAKSRVMKKWKDLDKRITDSANEAKDNVKYLYTLEKYCDPLYRQDPVSMMDSLPGLINAIRMIHCISRFYNTSERMTSLFIKVTNQMVTACKLYIISGSSERIWDMDRKPLVEKLQHCCSLYKAYQETFHRTKEKIEQTPGQKPFEFSEMYIFGKFETFCRRLEKVNLS